MSISKSKKMKTRMDHECFGCLAVCKKGSTVTTWTDTDGGKIANLYLCGVCIQVIEELYEGDDTIPYGKVRENDPELWDQKDREKSRMTLAELKRRVDHAVTQSQKSPEEVPVFITTVDRSMGQRAGSFVRTAEMGFDWEAGQFRIGAFDRLIKDGQQEAPLMQREGVGTCCGNCARKIAKDDLFCRHCGRKVKK